MSFLASRTQRAPQGIGRAVRRREDRRLLTGAGCYTDDVTLPGQAHACLVRSPHAHAAIGDIDVAEALAVPGVLAVLTGADAVKDGLVSITHPAVPTNPHEVPLRSRDGAPFFVAPHAPLPVDRARFVGEPVAMVVADRAAAARDAAERVRVDWRPVPAAVTSLEAIADAAPSVWDECASNLCVDSLAGDAAATDAAFAHAAHVVRLHTRVNRVTGVPMEPRAVVGDYDAATGRYTVYTGSGGSWRIQNDVARALGVPPAALRVVAREHAHRLPEPRPRLRGRTGARRRRSLPGAARRQHE
jgi:carbon-monoxide dehydrogenase large subunit